MPVSSDSDPYYRLRHSAAHVLAQAVLELFPEAKLGIGPSVEDGFYLSFAQILSEFGCWCQQSPTACEQTARCRGYCQQKAVMAAESTVATGQYVAGHSALPSTQPAALSICSSVSAINTIYSGRDALELTSNLRER